MKQASHLLQIHCALTLTQRSVSGPSAKTLLCALLELSKAALFLGLFLALFAQDFFLFFTLAAQLQNHVEVFQG